MAKGKVLLLGLGMQGRVALYDLVRSDAVTEITVVDTEKQLKENARALSSAKVHGVALDAAAERDKLAALMARADVTVDLLPARMAFGIAQLAAQAGCNLVNTNYCADPGEADPVKVERRRRDIEELRSKAKAKGTTLLFEFGMDPGIDLAMAGQVVKELDEVREFYSYGAGFPELAAADNPLKYKFSWSIEGVFRSYFRPARLIRNGKPVTIPADEQYDPATMHCLDVEGLGGRVECFPNGDAVQFVEPLGLRKAETVGRYTARWPGHGAFWYAMAKCGFLSDVPLKVGDATVTPLAFITSLLGGQKQFHYAEGERDIAYLRVEARGIKDGKKTRVICQVIDKRDLSTGFTAMSRTVGFPVSIGTQMIITGALKGRGLIGPLDVPFEPYRKELAKRGVEITLERLAE